MQMMTYNRLYLTLSKGLWTLLQNIMNERIKKTIGFSTNNIFHIKI